jgi:CCR4-NOT transcription complex subunit 1
LDELGVRRSVNIGDPNASLPDVYDQLAFHFTEWVRIYERSPSSEKSFVPWVTQVTSEGILRGEHLSSLFFRVCVEKSMELYNQYLKNRDETNAYRPIDALSKLIVFMVKYNGDAASASSIPTKVHYLTKILSIVVLVLAKAHEDDAKEFQPRPFFRLFSSLLSDLNSLESALQAAYFHLLKAMWYVVFIRNLSTISASTNF